ncbi:unnamed protein product [Ceratitis capitata]|uniref:(Mediterranean fruit fly) hypothetical protein n=1 Tax=Ceratitis capitata TaxID=7213 RepID=A0A811U0T8_CERCA|nr:unnamed protein product [Ceratitis capitata]
MDAAKRKEDSAHSERTMGVGHFGSTGRGVTANLEHSSPSYGRGTDMPNKSRTVRANEYENETTFKTENGTGNRDLHNFAH